MRILLTALIALSLSVQSAAPDLKTVIQRATEYVTNYEANLGNLIGTEIYVQNATWLHGQERFVSPGPQPGALPPAGSAVRSEKNLDRRTLADFLIIQVGPQWVALREVNQVNGADVRNDKRFDTAFGNSPADNTRLFNNLKADSTRYNLGDILRESNLPTFALQVLRKAEVSRFSFERNGEDRIDGVPTWRVRFRETKGPTLITSRDGSDLFSSGRLWIDPEKGRILKSEFDLQNRFAKPPIKSSVTVSYVQGKNVDILVPSLMLENYETEDIVINCRAEYSNFRPFQVDVKFELPAPKSKPF